MSKKIFFSLMTVTAILLLNPVGYAQKSKAKSKVDVFGYYFLAGQIPKELTDIDHLHLSTIDENGKDAPLNGVIRLKPKGRNKAVDFVLMNLKRNEKALSFTTKDVKGVNYKFIGNFLKLGDFPTKPPTKGIILEGNLTKFQGKKKIFEGQVAFRYEPGG